MSLTASAGEWTQVRFPHDLNGEAVDSRLAKLTPAHWHERLNLDLSETTSVDITALLRILALINDRDHEDQDTIISAPRSPEVRRRLEDWDFPASGAMVCRSSFRRPIWDNSLSRTIDQHGRHLSRTTSWNDEGYGKVVETWPFGFMTYVFETDTQASSVIDTEWARWRSPLVLSMFDARLGERSLEIARVVIYELLANAVQRPRANLVVVASHASEPATQGSRRQVEELTISVWDNGAGITQALRGSIESGHGATLVPNDTFLLESVGWTSVADRYRADWVPALDAPDEEYLISSLFPSGVWEADHLSRSQRSPGSEVVRQRQGYGLHALYRCVVDLFGGVLEIRTGSQHLTLAVAPRRRNRRFYRMRLQRLSGRPFRGNMITVRIPLKHAR